MAWQAGGRSTPTFTLKRSRRHRDPPTSAASAHRYFIAPRSALYTPGGQPVNPGPPQLAPKCVRSQSPPTPTLPATKVNQYASTGTATGAYRTPAAPGHMCAACQGAKGHIARLHAPPGAPLLARHDHPPPQPPPQPSAHSHQPYHPAPATLHLSFPTSHLFTPDPHTSTRLFLAPPQHHGIIHTPVQVDREREVRHIDAIVDALAFWV